MIEDLREHLMRRWNEAVKMDRSYYVKGVCKECGVLDLSIAEMPYMHLQTCSGFAPWIDSASLGLKACLLYLLTGNYN